MTDEKIIYGADFSADKDDVVDSTVFALRTALGPKRLDCDRCGGIVKEIRLLTTRLEALARENEKLLADNRALRQQDGANLSEMRQLQITVSDLAKKRNADAVKLQNHQEALQHTKRSLTANISENQILKKGLQTIVVMQSPESMREMAQTTLNHWKKGDGAS